MYLYAENAYGKEAGESFEDCCCGSYLFAVACKLQCLLSRLVNQDVAMPKIWYRLFRFLMVCGVGTEISSDVYFRLFLLYVFTFF